MRPAILLDQIKYDKPYFRFHYLIWDIEGAAKYLLVWNDNLGINMNIAEKYEYLWAGGDHIAKSRDILEPTAFLDKLGFEVVDYKSKCLDLFETL